MDACKAQIEELERSETARRMKRMRMVRRYTVDLLAPPLPRHTIPREKEVWMNLPYFDPSRKSGVGILPGTSRDVPIVVENEEEEEHVVDLLAFPELDLGEFEFVPQPEDQEKAERKEAGSNSSFVSASTSTLSSSSRKRALSEMERGGTNEDSAAKKPM
ncbi:hypothetical protein VTN49DRAFT_250 [Thermomyces lanuginosus]|uniref:uncharacterized protein n=1 Tax=Thermomyces lanuginosus TaxID=5541 RepID=UPI0037425F52